MSQTNRHLPGTHISGPNSLFPLIIVITITIIIGQLQSELLLRGSVLHVITHWQAYYARQETQGQATGRHVLSGVSQVPGSWAPLRG